MSRSLIGGVLRRDSLTSLASASFMLIMPVGEMEGRVIQLTLNHIMLTLKLKALIKVQSLTQTNNYRQVWPKSTLVHIDESQRKTTAEPLACSLLDIIRLQLFVSAIVCCVPPHSVYPKTHRVLFNHTNSDDFNTILKKSSSNTKSFSNHSQTNKHKS